MKFRTVALVTALACMFVAPSFAQQVKTYDNTQSLSTSFFAPPQNGYCYGEVIHLNSAAPITGMDLGYYCPQDVYGGGVICVNTSLTDANMGAMYSFNLIQGNNGLAHFDFGTDPATNPFYNITSQDLFLRFYFSTSDAGILTANSAGIGSSDASVYYAQWGPPPAYCYPATTPVTLDGKHLAVATYTTPETPEPGAFAVLATGLSGVFAFYRRRRNS